MKSLPSVTLVALTSNHIRGALRSIARCMALGELQFGAVRFLSDRHPEAVDPVGWTVANQDATVEWVSCPPIHSMQDYNRLALFEIPKHVETDFCLICHHDGYVVNSDQWTDEFLAWDYLGAPWPAGMAAPDHLGRVVRVGNGGFSLRSRRLLQTVIRHESEFRRWVDAGLPEDNILCCHGRGVLEAEGCRIAPVELAARFSHENACPEIEGLLPFGIHFPPASLQH